MARLSISLAFSLFAFACGGSGPGPEDGSRAPDGTAGDGGVCVPSADLCDGVDNDCDPSTPDGIADTTLGRSCDGPDSDECTEGTNECADGALRCSDETGDDAEVCNDADDDCDGDVDEDATDLLVWYADGDGDGFGDGPAVMACSAPAGHVSVDGDCDDASAAFHPGATETCSETIDYNCDGSVAYVDGDDDGFAACEECDDSDPDVRPDATEVCNDVDDDCDLAIDDADDGLDLASATSFYLDADDDGFGGASTVRACEPPPDHVTASGDCNDSVAAIRPGATEICNAVDDDCDGATDDADPGLDPSTRTTFYPDADADAWGVTAGSLERCAPPGGYATRDGDCAPMDAAVNPGATEILCDTVDNDCDGLLDDADPSGVDGTWYADVDGDGYGDPASPRVGCAAGYVGNSLDCYDMNAMARPGATGWFDASRGDGSFDYDCNGTETHELPSGAYCRGPDTAFRCSYREAFSGPDPGCGNSAAYQWNCLLENRAGIGLGCYSYTSPPRRQRCR